MKNKKSVFFFLSFFFCLQEIQTRFLFKLQITENETKKLMVAAIDFGTTFSGWGFSFDNDYKSDPTKISCKHW
jgi:hypothetical protein